MAKRFADTKLSREKWFRKLTPAMKCAVRFLFDECDEAGAWPIDEEAMRFYIGESISITELIKCVNSDGKIRLRTLSGDKLFLPGFVSFQYGELSADCNPHKKVIHRLKELDLWEGYTKGCLTLQEEEEEKDKEEEKEIQGSSRGVVAPQQVSRPTVTDADIAECRQTWLETLAAFDQPRESLTPAEELAIARAIAANGADLVETALYGARHEPSHGDWSPKDHVDLMRVLLPDKQGKPRLQKFVGYGLKARAKEAARRERQLEMERARQAVEPPEDEGVQDPERVRQLIQKTLGPRALGT